MGHRRGPDLSGYDLLLKIIHRDIGPHIAAEIDQDGVDALHGLEERGQVVVVFDLSGRFGADHPQDLLYKTISEPVPVDTGISDYMCVEIPGGAAEFCTDRNESQLVELVVKTLDENVDLLSKPGRGSRLAVGAGEHGNSLPGFCQHL